VSLYVYEPETLCALVGKMPAPVGQLSLAQVGLLLRFAIEQHVQVAGGQTRSH
jgi:hypothetical protein